MSADPYAFSSRDFAYRLRLEFGLSLTGTVTERTARHHERMADAALARAYTLARPRYHEPVGFCVDHFSLMKLSIRGSERAYGGSGPWRRELWRAVKHSFLAAWHDARGSERRRPGGAPRYAVITGITS